MSYESQTFVVLLVVLVLVVIASAIRKSPRFNRVRGSGNPYYDSEDRSPLDAGHDGEDQRR